MRKVFINISLLFLSIGLAFAVAEVVAWFYLGYQDKMLRQKRQDNILTQVAKRELYVPANPGSFANKADATVHWWGLDISTDSLGCRKGLSAPDTAELILFLGDSMIFGLGLPDSMTIPSLLQRELQDSQSVKVVNSAVIGYDFLQYLYQLERLTPKLKPSLVLVGICYNDLFPNEDPFRTVLADRGVGIDPPRRREGETKTRRASFTSRVKNQLRKTSIYQLVQRSDLKARLSKPKPPSYSEPHLLASKEKAPGLIDDFLRKLEELDLNAGFIYFPTPEEAGHESLFVYVKLLQERGQSVLDLGKSERIGEDSYFLRQRGKYMQPDIHFNLEGSRVVAEEIAEWGVERGLWE
jgi:lysophospholipase L1-like esterase